MLIGGIVARARPRPARRRQPRQPRHDPAAPDRAALRRGPRPVRDGVPAQRRRRRSSSRCGSRSSAASFALLLVALWANRGYPGMSLAFVGILANAVVIVVNGGYMPIWEPSLAAAGLDAGRRLAGAPLRPAAARSTRTSSSTSGRSPTSSRSRCRHPERRLDRRRLPDARARLLPVRRASSASRRSSTRPTEVVRAAPGRGRRRADRPAPGRATRARETGLSPALTARRRPRAAAGRWAARGPGWPRRRSTTVRADARARRRRRRRRRRPVPRPPIGALGHAAARRSRALDRGASASTRTSGSRSTARSRRCGPGQLISLFGDRLNQLALVAVVRDHDRLGARDRAGLLRGDAAEPAPQPDRGHVRRPLGPQGGRWSSATSSARRSSCSCRSPR